jgi:hypothetical protein
MTDNATNKVDYMDDQLMVLGDLIQSVNEAIHTISKQRVSFDVNVEINEDGLPTLRVDYRRRLA